MEKEKNEINKIIEKIIENFNDENLIEILKKENRAFSKITTETYTVNITVRCN